MKMFKLTKLGYVAVAIITALATTSCRDDFDDSKVPGILQSEVFDYSTATYPTVSISYQDLGFGKGVTTSVYFELYTENPLEEGEYGAVKKKNVMPFFAGNTKKDGTWTGTVELPAYVTKVYAYSPGALALDLMVSDVQGNTISFLDTDYIKSSGASSTRSIVINQDNVEYIGSYSITGCNTNSASLVKAVKIYQSETTTEQQQVAVGSYYNNQEKAYTIKFDVTSGRTSTTYYLYANSDKLAATTSSTNAGKFEVITIDGNNYLYLIGSGFVKNNSGTFNFVSDYSSATKINSTPGSTGKIQIGTGNSSYIRYNSSSISGDKQSNGTNFTWTASNATTYMPTKTSNVEVTNTYYLKDNASGSISATTTESEATTFAIFTTPNKNYYLYSVASGKFVYSGKSENATPSNSDAYHVTSFPTITSSSEDIAITVGGSSLYRTSTTINAGSSTTNNTWKIKETTFANAASAISAINTTEGIAVEDAPTYYLFDTEGGFLAVSLDKDETTNFAIFKSTTTSDVANYYLYSIKSGKFLVSAFNLSEGANNAKFTYTGLTDATLTINGKTFNVSSNGGLTANDNGTKWTLTAVTGDDAITDAKKEAAIEKIVGISSASGPVGTGNLYTNACSSYNNGGVATTPGGKGWKTWLGQYSNTAKKEAIKETAITATDSYSYEDLSGGIAYANQFYPYDYINSAGQLTNDRILNITNDKAVTLFTEYTKTIDYNKTCPQKYRSDNPENPSMDLEVSMDAAIAITLLGGKTGWANSIGYYYYSGNTPPQSINDSIVILIAPNTLDGHGVYDSGSSISPKGQGIVRGTTVQLYYFGEGDNFKEENKTNIFPKGTKIGFVLKSHAWNDGNTWTCTGVTSWGTGFNIDNANTHYSASTKTITRSYKDKINGGTFTSTGCCSFQPTGFDEVMLGFEDHEQDANFSDVVFTLTSNPSGSIDGANPQGSESDKTVTQIRKGVYAFEDLWPSKGDYDMNDVVVEAYTEKTYQTISKSVGSENFTFKQLVSETFHFAPYENYAAYYNGLAVKFEPGNEITEQQIQDAIATAVIKIDGETTDAPLLHYRSNTIFITDIINQYAYTQNAMAIANTSADGYTRPTTKAYDITITLTYKHLNKDDIFSMPKEGSYIPSTAWTQIRPFIYRLKSDTGTNPSTWEVHVPFEAPSPYADESYFGTEDDKSKTKNEKGQIVWTEVNRIIAGGGTVSAIGYYLRAGYYPFAFFAAGAEISEFEKLLDPDNETKPIDEVYTKFGDWATSMGSKATYWWK